MRKLALIILLIVHTNSFAINVWEWITVLVMPVVAPLLVPDNYPRLQAYIGGCATMGFFWCFSNWYLTSCNDHGNEIIENFHNLTISQLQEILKQYRT